MGYGEIWKILDELIIELRKRGETIPSDVMEDLRAAKTMIQVLKADPSRTENVPSIEMYLGNVESYLIFTAHQKLGADLTESWMQKIHDARKTIQPKAEEKSWQPTSKFVPGVPKGQRWLRVQVSHETPESEIERLAGDFGLATKTQPDGYVLVYGDEEKLKLFIHKASEKLQARRL
jgi:hypothetical protein